MRFLPLVLVLPALLPAAELSLKTMTAQMKYDTTEFTVTPGQPVTIQFENGDDLPHNFVLCKPGTDVVALSMLDDEFSDPVYSIRLFKLDALGGWLERQRLLSPDRRFNDSFGAALAASSDTLVVCAPGYGTPTTPNHGVCHDYRLAP